MVSRELFPDCLSGFDRSHTPIFIDVIDGSSHGGLVDLDTYLIYLYFLDLTLNGVVSQWGINIAHSSNIVKCFRICFI
jgi:hypothetical protein